MTSIIHNLASIFLGLMAWSLPVIYLMAGRRREWYCGGSFALCALSLYIQLREVMHRVNIGDLSAVMDTIGAVVFAATVLVVTNVVLNTLAMLRKE